MATTLIRNAQAIVTVDREDRVLRGENILVQDNVIRYIGPEERPADRVIDASHCFVYPGLVNTHHHLYQTFTRNLPKVQKMELFPWLRTLYEIWRGLDEDCIYYSSLVGLGELLKYGCTTWQGLTGDLFGNTGDLKHDTAGLDDCDPVLGGALTGTHAGLGRLLGDGLIGEDLDPDLTATLGITGHGDTGCFDLVAGDPRGLHSDEAKLTVGDLVASGGLAGHTAFPLLTRLIVSSWITTSSPSFVICTSSSIPSAPISTAFRNASNVFSGA